MSLNGMELLRHKHERIEAALRELPKDCAPTLVERVHEGITEIHVDGKPVWRISECAMLDEARFVWNEVWLRVP